MAKAVKIFGIIILTLMVLAGIGVSLLIHFVDPNKFKDDISTGVYDNTGRHLTIKGQLAWSFFPWVGFKVGDVELSNAANFGNAPFASAKTIDISVQVMPLLWGKVEVNNVELDGLHVNLIRNSAGQTNWGDLQAAKAPSRTNQAQPVAVTVNAPVPATTNVDFTVANLTVVNGQVKWQDGQHQQNYQLSNIYINGDNVGTRQVFALTVSMNVSGTHLAKPAKLNFSGQFNLTADLNSIAVNQIEAKLNQLNLQGDISVKNLQSTLNYQGDLHVTSFNLRNFLAGFAVNLPTFNSADALQAISTDLAFNGDKQNISIKPLALNVDSSKLTGQVNIKNFAAPAVNFKFSTNQLDMDDYLPAPNPAKIPAASAKASAPVVPATTPATKQDTPINLPLAMLRSLNVNGTLGINQLSLHNLNLSNVQLTLSADKGIVQLAPISLSLYEGTATGQLGLNVQSAMPQYTLQFTANKLQAEPFIQDLMNKDFITGTLNTNMSFSSSGNSVQDLTQALMGNGKIDFSNGQLQGINVENQLAQAKALLNKQNAPATPKNNTTSFGDIGASFTASQGILHSNDLLITNTAFMGKGQGTANLVSQQLNYQLNLTSTNPDELKGYFIPVDITGPLTNPTVQLDTDGILQQFVQQQKQQVSAQAQSKAANFINKQSKGAISSKHVSQALGKLFG